MRTTTDGAREAELRLATAGEWDRLDAIYEWEQELAAAVEQGPWWVAQMVRVHADRVEAFADDLLPKAVAQDFFTMAQELRVVAEDLELGAALEDGGAA